VRFDALQEALDQGLHETQQLPGRLPATHRAIPFRDGLPNRLGGVFLEEVTAGDRHLSLIRPGAAEIPLCARQNRARVSIDEQFRHVARGQPPGICRHYFHYVGGMAVDGDFPGPCECGPPGFPGLQVGTVVNVHFLLA
jgi:hypothetical protein